jgi:tRNA(Ile2) C34 agmatinyltransferase TiaS
MGNEVEVVEVKHQSGNLFQVWFLTDTNDQTYFHFYAKDELDAFRQAQEYISDKEQGKWQKRYGC